MRSKVIVFLKGICMGISDVIPGVSGGTMALILGIYERLIEALREIDLSFMRAVLDVLIPGSKRTWRNFLEVLQKRDLPFLGVLVGGAATAILGGSLVIPSLIADYPVAVRGFFFGLILGSVWIPYTMLETSNRRTIATSLVFLLAFSVAGFYLTGPDLRLQSSYSWTRTVSGGETLQEVLQGTSSARPPRWVLSNPRNDELRTELLGEDTELDPVSGGSPEHGALHHNGDEDSGSFASLHVPEGLAVAVPTIHPGFVFLAAFVAISAMILPGISGSYILLILGSYFYVTFSVKSFLAGLVDGRFALKPLLVLGIFVAGLLAGLAVLTRVLSYLLRNARAATIGALTGLMLGCLRGVWPYRIIREGVTMNVLPETFSKTVQNGLLFSVVGFAIVFSLSLIGRNQSPSPEQVS